MMFRLPRLTRLFGESPCLVVVCSLLIYVFYSLVRPDGKKKAYVRLTADHDALDVANKVRPSPPLPSYSLHTDDTTPFPCNRSVSSRLLICILYLTMIDG